MPRSTCRFFWDLLWSIRVTGRVELDPHDRKQDGRRINPYRHMNSDLRCLEISLVHPRETATVGFTRCEEAYMRFTPPQIRGTSGGSPRLPTDRLWCPSSAGKIGSDVSPPQAARRVVASLLRQKGRRRGRRLRPSFCSNLTGCLSMPRRQPTLPCRLLPCSHFLQNRPQNWEDSQVHLARRDESQLADSLCKLFLSKYCELEYKIRFLWFEMFQASMINKA